MKMSRLQLKDHYVVHPNALTSLFGLKDSENHSKFFSALATIYGKDEK